MPAETLTLSRTGGVDGTVIQNLYLLWFPAVIVGVVVSWRPTRAVSLALVFALLGSLAGGLAGTVSAGPFGSTSVTAHWAAIFASVGLPIGGLVGLAMIWRGTPHAPITALRRAEVLLALGGWLMAVWIHNALIEACTLESGFVAKRCHVDQITFLIGLDVLMLAALCIATSAIRGPSRGHRALPLTGAFDDGHDHGEADWWVQRHEAPR